MLFLFLFIPIISWFGAEIFVLFKLSTSSCKVSLASVVYGYVKLNLGQVDLAEPLSFSSRALWDLLFSFLV